nr:hypothetical protein KK1_036345 [Ipomoea trifida]
MLPPPSTPGYSETFPSNLLAYPLRIATAFPIPNSTPYISNRGELPIITLFNAAQPSPCSRSSPATAVPLTTWAQFPKYSFESGGSSLDRLFIDIKQFVIVVAGKFRALGFRREMEDSFPHGRRLITANELIVVGERKIQNRAVIFREPAIVNWLPRGDGVLMIIGSEYFRERVQEIPEGCPITHHVVHGKSQENVVTQLYNLDAQQGSLVTVMVDSSVV